MLKVVNFLKLLSIVLFLAILLLVYAYLPIMVKLDPEQGVLQLHKETFFYLAVSAFVTVNLVFLGFQRLFEKQMSREVLKAWVRGLAFVVNLYLTFITGFIGVINNPQHLKAEGFAYLNYLGPFLLICWLAGLFYLVFTRR